MFLDCSALADLRLQLIACGVCAAGIGHLRAAKSLHVWLHCLLAAYFKKVFADHSLAVEPRWNIAMVHRRTVLAKFWLHFTNRQEWRQTAPEAFQALSIALELNVCACSRAPETWCQPLVSSLRAVLLSNHLESGKQSSTSRPVAHFHQMASGI